MLFRIKLKFDESLDAWAIHGVGGLWGAIATGIFATEAIGGHTGLLYGNTTQFIAQLVGAGSAMLYAFVLTFVLVKLVELTVGLRVTEEEEYVGLDLAQHGERAYT
jgi:Amt family ammonium transporter